MHAYRMMLLDRPIDLPRRFVVACAASDPGAVTITDLGAEAHPSRLFRAPDATGSAIVLRLGSDLDRTEVASLRTALRAARVPHALIGLRDGLAPTAVADGLCDAVLSVEDEYALPLLATYAWGIQYGTAAHVLLDRLRDRWAELPLRLLSLALGSRFSISCVKAAVPFLGMSRWTLRRRLREQGIVHPDAVFGAAVAGIASLCATDGERPSPALAAALLRRDRRAVVRQYQRLWNAHAPPSVRLHGLSADLVEASSEVARACDRLVRLSPQHSASAC